MEQVIRKKSLFWEYFLLIYAVLWSGGSMTYGLLSSTSYFMVVLSAIVLIRRDLHLEINNWISITIFLVVVVTQMLVFSGPITAIVLPVSMIMTSAMIAVIIRPNFGYVFIRIMTFFALASVFFWIIDMVPWGHSILLNIGKGMPQFGAEKLAEVEEGTWKDSYSLFFYSVNDLPKTDAYYNWPRNTGPFFEPGRFTVFLTIAMSLILYNSRFRIYKMSFYMLLIANITTFSTTGFFAMFVLFISYIVGRKQSASVTNVLLILAIIIIGYYILQMSFIGGKITAALDDTDNANSRFGAMYYHWIQITNSPIIGYGTYLEKVFGQLEMSPCGITDMMRQWGIPLFFLSVILLYQGTKTYLVNIPLFRLSFTIVLLILAYTQTIMSSPLFYTLYFIGSKKFIYDSKL